MCMSADLTTCTRIRPWPNACTCLQQNIYKPNLDTTVTSCIMPTDNLPRLGLESVDSFNCAHGEGFLFSMEYLKPHLSLSQQVSLLKQRGLVADTALLSSRLKDVGYYRFSAYLHPFRERNQSGAILDSFIPGTTLDKVWNHYLFDRKLRLLLIDAIERIEVALRSQIAYHHTVNQSPFSYTQANYFPLWKGYINCLDRVKIQRDKQGQPKQSGVDYIDHFFHKYGDKHDYLPLWMAVGVMDFGTIVYFYSHSNKSIRRAIAKEWNIDTASLFSWLSSLRGLRNDCAHHSRIWNKVFLSLPKMQNKPVLPWDFVYSEKARKWVKPTASLAGFSSMLNSQSNIAPLIFICRYLLSRVAPTSQWPTRMQQFLLDSEQNGINLRKMGLPLHWEQHPLWK